MSEESPKPGIVQQILQSQGFQQGLSELTSWVGHGATEAANVLLNGHVAPVYSHSLSPAGQAEPESQLEPTPTNPDVQPITQTIDTESVASIQSDSLQVTPSETPETQEMVTSHGAPSQDAPSIVDQLIENAQAMPSLEQSQEELSR